MLVLSVHRLIGRGLVLFQCGLHSCNHHTNLTAFLNTIMGFFGGTTFDFYQKDEYLRYGSNYVVRSKLTELFLNYRARSM